MKGIILASGLGSRLHPLTEITNKHLLPVGKEPMIWHPVRQLVLSKIEEILIVTSTHHMGDIVNSLGCVFAAGAREVGGLGDPAQDYRRTSRQRTPPVAGGPRFRRLRNGMRSERRRLLKRFEPSGPGWRSHLSRMLDLFGPTPAAALQSHLHLWTYSTRA